MISITSSKPKKSASRPTLQHPAAAAAAAAAAEAAEAAVAACAEF